MTASSMVPATVLSVLVVMSGCGSPDKPLDELATMEMKPNLHVAPTPRAKEEGLPPPPAEVVARPTKPWPELIVGKWFQVNRKNVAGDVLEEFTRDGMVIERYSYQAAPGHSAGIEVGTHEYRVEGNILRYPSIPEPFDDGIWVRQTTTFIETLTEGELVTLSVTLKHPSLRIAEREAATRNVPVEAVLNRVCEERGRVYYVRVKDEDK